MPCVRSSLRTCGVAVAPLASQSRTRSSSTLIVDGSVCGLYWPRISIVRPSRGERESAATMRQIAFLRAPTRVSRSRTAMKFLARSRKRRGRLAGLAHQGLDVGHAPAPDLLHDLAHLAELLDELVDRLHVGA